MSKYFSVHDGNNTFLWPLSNVHDGDTIEILVNCLPQNLQKISIRVFGLDTPELHSSDPIERSAAEKAKEFAQKSINDAHSLSLELKGWDKYGGRVLAKVIVDGKDLTQMIIDAKLGRAYYGDKKKPWAFPIQ